MPNGTGFRVQATNCIPPNEPVPSEKEIKKTMMQSSEMTLVMSTAKLKK
jgi:hypothetical protein